MDLSIVIPAYNEERAIAGTLASAASMLAPLLWMRGVIVVYDGRIVSLRRFKDDVQTVATGFECGIGLAKFKDIKEGDKIESYEVNEIERT